MEDESSVEDQSQEIGEICETCDHPMANHAEADNVCSVCKSMKGPCTEPLEENV